jgi:hypothetical protein
MKTTLEIPDNLFRQAKAAAARQGLPLRELVTKAIAAMLSHNPGHDRPWMESFGKLSALRNETARINKMLNRDLGKIDPED